VELSDVQEVPLLVVRTFPSVPTATHVVAVVQLTPRRVLSEPERLFDCGNQVVPLSVVE